MIGAALSRLAALMPGWCWWVLVLAAILGIEEMRLAGQRSSLATAADRIESLAGERDACRATRANLELGVEEQHRAIAEYRRAAEQRQAIAREARMLAANQALDDYRAANRLQQERTGGDACAAAEAVIDQELGLSASARHSSAN